MNAFTRYATRGIATLGIAGAIALAGAGLANAEPLPAANNSGVRVTSTPSPANYQGTWALTEKITNNSGQELTLQTATNDFGHWQDRPTNLAPGQSETVSSYNDSPHVNATDEIDLVYDLPNGDYVSFDGIVYSMPGFNQVATSIENQDEVGITSSITQLDHATATITITNPNA